MRQLYPALEPFNQFYFRVSDVHELYVEEVGNPQGQPILFLHGGPGAGSSAKHRRFFDPKKYRVIIFDQRGAGRSRPFADLTDNTTWHLVKDIEALREHLGIRDWHVFGGSWGSTLALSYAVTHPDRVKRLILRGIFLCRPEEIKWFYQEGAHQIFPDEWESYVQPIPESERGDMVRSYYKYLTDKDPDVRANAAKRWSEWEGSTLKLIPDPEAKATFGGDSMALALARIECHYFINNAFFPTTNYLLEQAGKLKDIPGVIIHGRYDVVCPVKNAFDLHKVWPQARLIVVPDAGHAADEPGILSELVRATDEWHD